MDVNGINGETLRFFVSLLFLCAGLFAAEVIVGFFWMDLAPTDVPAVLVGGLILLALTGTMSFVSRWIGTRFSQWYRWIFGIAIGLVLPLKMGITHQTSLLATGALTVLLVVLVDALHESSHAYRILPLTFLFLLVLSGDWFRGSEMSVIGEIALGTLTAVILAGILVGLYRGRWVERFRTQVSTRWAVGSVLIVLGIGLLVWLTVEARDQEPSYFSGTVPEVSGPKGTSLKEMPNVILISVDTLRIDRVPPFADEELQFPALRSLMRDSVRFTRVFSSSSWTLPSHASLFTGLPPMAHGAVNPRRSRIYSAVPSYVQMLRNLGYQTAAFTDGGNVSDKFGFGRGFERYRSGYGPGRARTDSLQPGIQSWGQGLLDRLVSSSRLRPLGTEPSEYHYFWENLRAARTWLSNEREPDRPFFMFLHTYQAHDYFARYPRIRGRLEVKNPRLARAARQMGGMGWGFRRLSPEEKQRLLQRLETVESSSVRSSFSALANVHPPVWNVMKSWVLGQRDGQWEAFLDLSVENQKNVLYRASRGARRWGLPVIPNLRTDYGRTPYNDWLRSTFNLKLKTVQKIQTRNRLKMEGLEWLYDDLVKDVDRSLGEFLDHLRSKSLYEETLIVFLSDHGEGFSMSPQVVGHGFRSLGDGRGQLHDVLTRVPVLMKPPEDAPSTGVCKRLYQLRDVFPLVFRKLGVRIPDNAPRGKLAENEDESSFCPRSRRTLAKGSVTQRKAWLEFRPRFYVRGKNYRLEVQREPVELRSFWTLEDGEPDRRVPSDVVPESSRKRLRDGMENYLRRFDEHPDPYRHQGWEANEELEAELRGLGYF